MNRNKKPPTSNNAQSSLTAHRNIDANINYNECKNNNGFNKNNTVNGEDEVKSEGNYSGNAIPEEERKGLEELLKEVTIFFILMELTGQNEWGWGCIGSLFLLRGI